MKRFVLILLTFTTFFLTSCGEEGFKINRVEQSNQVRKRTVSSSASCSLSTLIRPKVDFLFLWDNSSSTLFINNETKSALNNMVNNISNRFDYRVMHAPLMGTGNANTYVVSSDPLEGNLNGVTWISQDSQGNMLSLYQPDSQFGSREPGFSRVIDLINANKATRTIDNGQEKFINGVFREGAYTMIVLMSNGDDNEWDEEWCSPCAASRRRIHRDAKLNELMCIRGNYNATQACPSGARLNSLQMRFFSVVAHSQCKSGYRTGQTYKEFSQMAFSTPYTNGTNQQMLSSSNTPDSYNICTNSFSSIFSDINSTLQEQVIAHKYDYWAVAPSNAPAFDTSSIKVVKNTGEEFFPVTQASGQDGFEYVGVRSNQNRRFEPTPGEPFSGHMIRLYGRAQVTYPECMVVETKSPVEYFGYVHLNTKPVEGSIQLSINGANISKSSTNGWQLMKSGNEPQFITNQNIKITSPTNFSPATPAVTRTGYFLRLSGSAIYSNGDVIDVTFDPAGN